jgi:potassium-dependent mechanosensitive channel
MKRLLIVCAFLSIGFGVLAQSKNRPGSSGDNQEPIGKVISDIVNNKKDSATLRDKPSLHKKLILARDTLALSDYMMSIDRVNDNLNSIRDSSNLKFEVVGMGRRVDVIAGDVSIIRKNIRGRGKAFSIKNLYLYQNFTSDLNIENDRIEAKVAKMYNRVYDAKLSLKTALSDSVFRVLFSRDSLRNTFNEKLVRLERKWDRLDSTAKANVDTLNALKIKIADNAVNLSNMLNIMDVSLDRADMQLFGPEVNYLWQKAKGKTINSSSSGTVITKVGSEKNAIGYYFNKKSNQRVFVNILGILLLIWLFTKRKLLKSVRDPNGPFGFLNLEYLNKYPVLSVLVSLMCLMPFFDAYAPTSYIAIEYLLMLILSSVIFFKKENLLFRFGWLTLVTLFIAYTVTYLFIEPSFVARLWLLALHLGIIVFSFLFYRKLDKNMPYYKLIKVASITAMILSGLGIICNLFGRFSLSGILGISAIFAITHAVILPVFVETIVEIILLQLQSSRLKKGFDSPFDRYAIVRKIKIPLVIIAIFLWLIMLTSNLNIYHSITDSVVSLLTAMQSVGNISFRLISVLYFFVIIWFAHILQQMISFLFGETGIEMEDVTPVFKKQHSKLLITRLLVLVGGYLLAIAASGLPIDKITILLGALGVGIGMGLQNIVNNFVSGIILIFDSSFKIGDEIEVSGQAGKVKEIGLRSSTLTTADGADVIIPNGNMLSQNIVNWTLTNDQKRVMMWFNLSGKELDANVINEVINETIKNIPDVISEKKPVILYSRVTPEKSTLTVRFWSTIKNADHVKSEAMLKLGAAFANKNIQFK